MRRTPRRWKKNNRSIPVHWAKRTGAVLQAVFFVLPLYQTGAQSSPTEIMREEISWSLVNEVRYAPDLGKERKLLLLESALEYHAENSDASYLLARLLSENGGINAATMMLEGAFSSDQWRFFSPDQAVLLHIQVLAQLRNRDRIYDVYMRDGKWRKYIHVPDILFSLAYSTFRGNHLLEAREIIDRAALRFPEDSRFRALSIMSQDPPLLRNYSWLLDMAAAGERNGDEQNHWIHAAMLQYLFQMEEGKERKDLLAAYMAYPQRDLLSSLIYLDDLPDDHREEFLHSSLADSRDLSFILSAIRMEGDPRGNVDGDQSGVSRGDPRGNVDGDQSGVSQALSDILNRNSLNLYVDTDRNGISELELFYSNGRIMELYLDWDQNGNSELFVLFDTDRGGQQVPFKAVFADGNRQLEIQYGIYPAVFSAGLRVEEEGFTRESLYYLAGESYFIPVIDFREPDFSDDPLSDLRSMLKGEWRYRDIKFPRDSKLGVDLNIREIAATSSILDEIRASIFLVETRYMGGDLTGEVQQSRFENEELLASRFDADGDGGFERIQLYDNGILTGIYQMNDDGMAYMAEYDEEGNLLSERLSDHRRLSGDRINFQPFLDGNMWNIPE